MALGRCSVYCAFACFGLACSSAQQPASEPLPPPAAGSAAPVAGANVSVGGTAGVAGGVGAIGGAGARAVFDAGLGPAGAGAAGAGAAGVGTIDAAVPTNSAPDSADALRKLEAHLALPRSSRPDIAMQPFAAVALAKADAERAAQLLWDDYAAFVRESRKAEVGATESTVRTILGDKYSLRYYLARRGDNPPGGRSLFISMHGGGNAGASTNDSQWQNQLVLVDDYKPKDAVWVAPRAPIDDWNMWFVEGIDALFDRLITDMIVFEGVNPNKVYIAGYSAGGDGVYQLGPRMAERWAGAGMSAGHPNSASPLSLRNLAFAIHVGGADTAYDRNKKAEEWGKRLEMLAAMDPGGYVNQWQVHAGLPHWMNMEDAVSVPFMQSHVRDPIPKKIVWEQAEVTRATAYWLAVDPSNQIRGTEIRASYDAQAVDIATAKGVKRIAVRLSDGMLNLDAPVRVVSGSAQLYLGSVPRRIAVLARTLEERGDPTLMFCGEVVVEIP
jgi:poly(3-hydroxybutyrate) depolymerase